MTQTLCALPGIPAAILLHLAADGFLFNSLTPLYPFLFPDGVFIAKSCHSEQKAKGGKPLHLRGESVTATQSKKQQKQRFRVSVLCSTG
jgi:hypothetical protein